MKQESLNKLNDLQSEGFEPLSDEAERQITGGVNAPINLGCPAGQKWDPNLSRCVWAEVNDQHHGGSSGSSSFGL